MKILKGILFLILCSISILGLAQTAEKKENPAMQVEGEDKDFAKTLRWVDEETGQKLFDLDDIVRFDWDKQIFELTRRKAMDLLANLKGLGQKFKVADNTAVIYQGTFVSPAASMTFHGPVIVRSLPYEKSIQPPLFKIQDGYHSPSRESEPDLRFSEQLKKALRQANLLGEIDVNNPPAPIEKDSHGWFGKKGGLRVWVDVFPETFRLRDLARVHLYLTGGNYLNIPGYVVEVNATLVANNGNFEYSTNRIFPAHKDDRKSIYIMGMNPWVSKKDSKYINAEAGPANLIFKVSTRKIIDGKKMLYSEPVESVNTGPINVAILSQERNEVLEEAKAVMIKFQQALKASEWNKALSVCSDVVQSDAKEYESSKIFFKDVVPIEQIISVSNIQAGGGQFGPDNKRLAYFCFLRLSEPDAKPTINWGWRLNKIDSGWVVDFKNIPLNSWIEQEKLRLNREHEKAKERDRTLQEGLKLSLVPLSDGFVIGEPMLFCLEMTNISESPIAYEKTFFLMINNPITVIAPDSKRLEYLSSSVQTAFGPPVNIAPNQTVVLVEEYDVTNQYNIIKPGQYTFQFTGHWVLKSNIVKMDVKPGQLSALDSIVEKLVPILPEGWRLTRHMSDGIVIHLVGKSRRKGKDSGIGLSIYVNPDKSNLRGELLGQTKWGPVYVNSLNAELLWPDYKKQIVNALGIETKKTNVHVEGKAR